MKPTYSNFEAKKSNGFLELPPVGAYVAEIKQVRLVEADGKMQNRDVIELMIDITEGEYANRYMDFFTEQRERFGDTVKYKGVFRLTPPIDGEEGFEWRQSVFQGNLWCVQQSNAGYTWDWDETKLKGKKVGINVRKRLYTFNGQDRETTEIGRFETVDDVRNGKVKPMRDRDQRTSKSDGSSADPSGFTDVSKEMNVPW